MVKPLKQFSVQEIRFTNNLPYALTVEYCPKNKFINRIYYKFTDAAGNRVFYRSVIVKATDEFTRLPNIQVNVPGTLRIEEVIDETIISYTEHKIVIPEMTLGKVDLDIETPIGFRINLNTILADINKYYGPSAYETKTKLRFSDSDWYNPASDTINYAAGGRNLIHELIHASRKTLLLSSKDGIFDEKLEMLEEFFAEGLSDQIQGLYSTHLYNFDYLVNDVSLASENLQSSWGGIGFLEQCRYFLLSAAFWKLNFQYNKLTGRYLGKEFNSAYYARISSGEQPSREMFVSIISCLIPKIEGVHTRSWIDSKPIFSTENRVGKKTWIYAQDYNARGENLAIVRVHAYETFGNGSDWLDTNDKYDSNGSEVNIEINRILAHRVIKLHKVEATIPNFTGGFGAVKLYLHSNLESPVSKELLGKEPFGGFNFHCPWGLYEIIVNGKKHYRLLGDSLDNPLSVVASTSKVLSVHSNGVELPRLVNSTGNVYRFKSTKDQIIKIKTSKGSYERIIKSGKNHLFL